MRNAIVDIDCGTLEVVCWGNCDCGLPCPAKGHNYICPKNDWLLTPVTPVHDSKCQVSPQSMSSFHASHFTHQSTTFITVGLTYIHIQFLSLDT